MCLAFLMLRPESSLMSRDAKALVTVTGLWNDRMAILSSLMIGERKDFEYTAGSRTM